MVVTSLHYHVVCLVILCFLLCFCGFGHALYQALLVFGASQLDVGNNNYLVTPIKVNFHPYGIDYPGGEATGRFSNADIITDYLAKHVGLEASPKPYLSPSFNTNKTTEFLKGVNFASGGAGILDSTNKGLCIAFSKQVDYFNATVEAIAKQIGPRETYKHISKSLIVINIGNNDILVYNGVGFSSIVLNGTTPDQYVDQLMSSLQPLLKKIYNLGGRKFVIIGAGAQGCLPVLRARQATGDCNEDANYLSRLFNERLASLMQELLSSLGGLKYSFFNPYTAFVELYNNRGTNGFTEVKVACCGAGNLNGTIPCNRTTIPCSNRTNHVFWDGVHNTQAVSKVYMSIAFHGSPPYVYPINVKQLND
ncbi:GDSL lipase/esterase protein [Dioscorea alata]|uniref:GDSL lipase/esterase protein n=1 Tax=Dioscorea alata TaxID=55571 RepID=A0ACB7UNM6_DIOAL|nr:GDSL lipase/esterase protein [Dioscorea alata]